MKGKGKRIHKAIGIAAILALMVGTLLTFAGSAAGGAGQPLLAKWALPQGQTFIVNSNADDANAHDNNPGDGWCLDTYERWTGKLSNPDGSPTRPK